MLTMGNEEEPFRGNLTSKISHMMTRLSFIIKNVIRKNLIIGIVTKEL